jgi:hypothetical protein
MTTRMPIVVKAELSAELSDDVQCADDLWDDSCDGSDDSCDGSDDSCDGGDGGPHGSVDFDELYDNDIVVPDDDESARLLAVGEMLWDRRDESVTLPTTAAGYAIEALAFAASDAQAQRCIADYALYNTAPIHRAKLDRVAEQVIRVSGEESGQRVRTLLGWSAC